MNKSKFKVFPIDENTWRLEDSFEAYCYLLEGREKAMLIDTGTGVNDLAATVTQLTDKPVFVLNTHGHFDHVGCNYQFETAFLSRDDTEVLKEYSGTAVRLHMMEFFNKVFAANLPERDLIECSRLPGTKNLSIVKDGDRIDLGGRILEVIATPGHTKGSLCVLEAEKRRLFSGDTVCAQAVLLYFPASSPVAAFRDSLQKLLERRSDYDLLYPGHHAVPLDLSYVQEYLSCANKIISGETEGSYVDEFFGDGWNAKEGRISLLYRKERIV